MASKHSRPTERRKISLIIANDHYAKSENQLPDCTKTAYQLRDKLKNIHFEVECVSNVETNMINVVKSFHEKVRSGDLILFYFSGHAYAVDGKIYLLPIKDKHFRSNLDVEDLGTDVELVIERIIDNRSSCSVIIILDCCRPYVLKQDSTSSGKVNPTSLN